MSDTNHTLGEWELSEGTDFVMDKKGNLVCQLFTKHEIDMQNKEANAALIAQSPVMYTFIMQYIEAMKDKGKLTIHETALLDSAKQIVKQLS